MKASEFDKKFDDGVEDIMDDLDTASMRRPNKEMRRVNVDFPVWMIARLDQSRPSLHFRPLPKGPRACCAYVSRVANVTGSHHGSRPDRGRV